MPSSTNRLFHIPFLQYLILTSLHYRLRLQKNFRYKITFPLGVGCTAATVIGHVVGGGLVEVED
jgi:hypothetical protein